MNELIRMADGTRFHVRPMVADDGAAVRAGFASLSPASLHARFFSPVHRLTPVMLDDLAAVVPGQRIVLLAFESSSGRLVGGARAVRHELDPTTADVAVTVGDAWQRRGLGTALLKHLRWAARAEGIERLVGHVLTENDAARRLVRAAGGTTSFDEPGVLRFDIAVAGRAVVAA